MICKYRADLLNEIVKQFYCDCYLLGRKVSIDGYYTAKNAQAVLA